MLPVFATALASDRLIWFIAELLAFVLIAAVILRWRPSFLGNKSISATLSDSLDRRAGQIDEQLSAAERSREEAAKIRAQSEQDIARAREEGRQIVGRAGSTSQSILEELQVRAREEYDRIVAQARTQIDYERQQAEMALQRRAADIVVDAAQEVVQRNLDSDSDRRIIGSSLDDLKELR